MLLSSLPTKYVIILPLYCPSNVCCLVMSSLSFLVLIICEFSLFKNQHIWSFIKFIVLFKESDFLFC